MIIHSDFEKIKLKDVLSLPCLALYYYTDGSGYEHNALNKYKEHFGHISILDTRLNVGVFSGTV